MKKILLSILLLLPILASGYDFQVNGIYYTKNWSLNQATGEEYEDGTVSVSWGENTYSGDFVIPQTVTYQGVEYKITAIEYVANWYGYGKKGPFYESNIKSITIGNNITVIPNETFYSCPELTRVVLPNNLKSIGNGAFSNCPNLITCHLPEGIEEIGDWAFEYCTGLISIKLPQSLKKYGSGMFDGCDNLTSINLPNNMTLLPQNFFTDCKSLNTIALPESLTEIGRACFYRSAIESIVIPNSVKSIDELVFFGCSKLVSIKLPENLESINHGVFAGCSMLTSIQLGDKIKRIGGAAFQSCKELKTINLPSSITTIEGNAFENTGLLSVSLPSSLENIAMNSFSNCYSLESVYIPGELRTIYSGAFLNCQALKEIYAYPTTPPMLYNNSFSNYNATLYVSEGKLSDYKNAENWKKFSNIQEMNGTTKKFFISVKYNIAGGSVKLNEGNIESGNVRDFAEESHLKIQILPYENYVIQSVTLDGNDITSELKNNEFDIESIKQDYSLVVTFKEVKENYNVTFSFNNCGEIALNEQEVQDNQPLTVKAESDAVITITPDPGYDISVATANGISFLSEIIDGNYTLKKINDDYDITVRFGEMLQHKFITVNHGGFGEVLLNGKKIASGKKWGYSNGENVVMEIIPNDGYRVKSVTKTYTQQDTWYATNENITYDISDEGKYIFEEINNNYSISIEFETIPFYLYVVSSMGREVAIPVRSGERQEVRIPKKAGSEIVRVTYEGEDVTSSLRKDGSFITPEITSDVHLIITYNSALGNVDVNGDGKVNAADVVALVNIILGNGASIEE